MAPSLQLDPRAEEPLYRQLYRQLRDRILSGAFPHGQRIPPTRELAGQLGVNRATVAAAYELLEQEGLIRGHVGRGSFVSGAAMPPAMDWDARLASGAEGRTWDNRARIDFVSARPGDDLLPLEDFRACGRDVLRGDLAGILRLGSPFGYGPLREYLLEQARREGCAREDDDILVTSGCQQALDLLGRALVRDGQTAAIEDPVYPGLREVFSRAGARLTGIPVQEHGLDLEALARILDREPVSCIAVTPNFQNPTGASMGLDARRQLLRLARQARVAVIENDIYSGLRYEGEALPSLKQLDQDRLVIQIRSVSKLALPGLRVGWITGPREAVRRLAAWKQTSDLHSDHLSQAVLLRFAESGRLQAHRRRLAAAGRLRLHAALAASARHLPAEARFIRPEGGANLWIRLPEPLDAERILPRAEEAGVSYLPGRVFAVERPQTGALRLCFAGLDPSAIEEGVRILGRIFRKEWQRQRAAAGAGLAPAIV